MDTLPCPFCDHKDSDAYFLTQHVELCHPENGESPFIARESNDEVTPNSAQRPTIVEIEDTRAQDDSDEEYVDCPHKCGESLLPAELPSHMDMHVAEGLAIGDSAKENVNINSSVDEEDEVEQEAEEQADNIARIESNFTTHLPRALRNRQPNQPSTERAQPSQGSKAKKKDSIIDKLLGATNYSARSKLSENGGQVKRLGRKELGPYAYENQMPTWLRKLIEDSSKPKLSNEIGPNGSIVKVAQLLVNETADIIPVLAQLCEQDRSVQEVFFCNDVICHVCKIDREGGFCGYRNLQMQISYIRNARADGFQHFPESPSIFNLQDLIENAWDSGFNSHGRIETGGIKGTRKYIGTPEAQAVFDYLGIKCEAGVFSQTKEVSATENLLDDIEQYFRSGSDSFSPSRKVHQTFLPPVYFQHQGHSLTIIGIEFKKNGAANLLVFDPIFKIAPGIVRLLGTKFISPSPDRLLKAYRRGWGYLKKYRNFEILKLSSPYEVEE